MSFAGASSVTFWVVAKVAGSSSTTVLPDAA
jgi:hypothetical protein